MHVGGGGCLVVRVVSTWQKGHPEWECWIDWEGEARARVAFYLRSATKPERGVVQFVMWVAVAPELGLMTFDGRPMFPMALDLGYHSPTPAWEGQEPMDEECELLGGRCFYDGSGLNAENLLGVLRTEGADAVWATLADCWVVWFGSGS